MNPTLAIAVFSGLNVKGGPGSGPWGLYWSMWERFPDRRQSLIRFSTWNSDHRATAQVIHRYSPDITILIGHSYGVGWAMTRVTWELARLGRRVNAWMCIDAVPRYPLPFKPLSLTRFGSVRVPATVDEAFNWRQVNKRSMFDPVGRPLAAAQPDRTVIRPETVFGTPDNLRRHAGFVPDQPDPAGRTFVFSDGTFHDTIDEDPRVHAAVHAAIDDVIAAYARARQEKNP